VTVPLEVGPCVYVVATPIGNLDDFSPRATAVLRAVDVIACEDTRRTARLCARFEIDTRRVSLHAHNEASRVAGLIERLERGESIALVSDAGTPLVSDPGSRFVSAAIDAGHRVVAVPGPSAVLAALVASGLPARPFTFVGFLPRKGRERARWLDHLRVLPGSLVLFEAANRVHATLRDLHEALGARRVAVSRELTKRFEETRRGVLGSLDLPELKGEVTLVVEGNVDFDTPAAPSEEDLDARIADLLAAGNSRRDTARTLASETGLPRAEAYRRVLAAKDTAKD